MTLGRFFFLKWVIIIIIMDIFLNFERCGGSILAVPRGSKQQPAVGPQSNLMKRITLKLYPTAILKHSVRACSSAVYPVIYL